MAAEPACRASAPPHVAVVGGGVAGLVAARELALGGARVTLFEASARFGGRIRRETVAGIPLDVGAEAFANRGGGVAALIAELGLSEDVEAPAGSGSWLVSEHGAVPAPPAGLLGIPARAFDRRTVAALGLPGALRVALEPCLPRRIGSTASSLAALVRARLGRRALDRLVAPVVLGVHSTDPGRFPVSAEISAAYAEHGSLLAAGRALRAARPAGAAVSGLRGGMATLVDALLRELAAAGVELRAGEPVARVEPAAAGSAGWEIRAGDTTRVVDAVVFASADAYASAAASLRNGTPRETANPDDPDPVPDPSVTVEVVVLVLEDDRLDPAPRGTGALVSPGLYGDARPGEHAKALTHVMAKWPHRAWDTPGTHVLRLSYGSASAAPATLGMDDEALTRRARADASLILGVELRHDQLRGMHRARWDTPTLRPDPDLPNGWAVAGDWVSGTGLASVVPGARAAARAALTNLHATGTAVSGRTPQPSEHASR